jgi:hypothetical protein
MPVTKAQAQTITTATAAHDAGLINDGEFARMKSPHMMTNRDTQIAREAVDNAKGDPNKEKIAKNFKDAVNAQDRAERNVGVEDDLKQQIGEQSRARNSGSK